jgi:hypothetical protein
MLHIPLGHKVLVVESKLQLKVKQCPFSGVSEFGDDIN